nr:MAG TPA: hypothetical protein [Caudoviricetes sp.]
MRFSQKLKSAYFSVLKKSGFQGILSLTKCDTDEAVPCQYHY